MAGEPVPQDDLPTNLVPANDLPDDITSKQGMTGQLPRTGLDVLNDAVSQLVNQPKNTLNTLNNYIGKPAVQGAEILGQVPGQIAAKGLDALTIPGFAENAPVLPTLGKYSPTYKTAGGALITSGIGAATEGLPTKIVNAIADIGGSLFDFLQSAKEAGSLGTTETPTTAGMLAKTHALMNQSGIKANINDLYSKVPPDISGIPMPEAQSAGDSHINNIKSLSDSVKSSLQPVTNIATDLQELKTTTLQNASALQTDLANLARNGSGSQKKYAYDLLQGVEKDLDNFAQQGTRTKAQTIMSANMTQPGVRSAGMGPSETPSINPNNDAIAKLNAAKMAYADNAGLLKQPVIKALQKAAPNDMTDVVFKSGDVSKLLPAQKYLGDGYKVLQQDFYNQLLDAPNITKALNKFDDTFLQKALTPQMYKGIQVRATLQSFGNKAVRLAELGGGIGLLDYLRTLGRK